MIAQPPPCLGTAETSLAERHYLELLGHAARCARCWPWRLQLWRARRLCAAGRGLVDAYAAALLAEQPLPIDHTPLQPPVLGAVASVAAAPGRLPEQGA